MVLSPGSTPASNLIVQRRLEALPAGQSELFIAQESLEAAI